MHWTEQGAAALGRGPPVVSIRLESMVMVLDCTFFALEAQLIQNLPNKPLTKFGTQIKLLDTLALVQYCLIIITKMFPLGASIRIWINTIPLIVVSRSPSLGEGQLTSVGSLYVRPILQVFLLHR